MKQLLRMIQFFFAVPVKEGIEKSGSHFYNSLLNYSRKIIKHCWSVFF